MSIPGILKNTLVLLLLLWAASAWAQPKDNSPYSRLGLGDFVPQTMVSQMGTGGWGAALNDPYHLNLLNPASFAFLASTSYDVGLYAKYARLQGGDEAANIWSGNLRYLALAFPLQNPVNQSLDKKNNPFKWGMGFALTPFTNVGYDIQTTEVLPGVDTTTNIFRGTGGTYKLTWSNGWRYKNFALGLNLAYFFGKMNYARQVFFNDLGAATYHTFFDDAISVSGLTWNGGLQYAIPFKKTNEEGERVFSGQRLVLGATANTGSSFRTNSSRLYRGVNTGYADTDTVVNETDVIGQGMLPMEWSAGLMFESNSKWRLGAEYRFSQWSQYENEAKPETFHDTWKISGGVEYTPDANSYNKFAKRIRYQFGAFYGTDPRSYKTELENYGLTLGAGIPILLPRQQISFVHAALEVGFFGAPGELRETYGRLSLGFTLNDNSWFFKRKFF
jgi:opacity protein-like surface antigen